MLSCLCSSYSRLQAPWEGRLISDTEDSALGLVNFTNWPQCSHPRMRIRGLQETAGRSALQGRKESGRPTASDEDQSSGPGQVSLRPVSPRFFWTQGEPHWEMGKGGQHHHSSHTGRGGQSIHIGSLPQITRACSRIPVTSVSLEQNIQNKIKPFLDDSRPLTWTLFVLQCPRGAIKARGYLNTKWLHQADILKSVWLIKKKSIIYSCIKTSIKYQVL